MPGLNMVAQCPCCFKYNWTLLTLELSSLLVKIRVMVLQFIPSIEYSRANFTLKLCRVCVISQVVKFKEVPGLDFRGTGWTFDLAIHLVKRFNVILEALIEFVVFAADRALSSGSL